MDKQVHENELLIPSLRIIKDHPYITTSELIKELEKTVTLYEKDKKILNNRSDTYFSQTVRNQCGSHLATNKFGKCVIVKRKENKNCFVISPEGLEVLNEEVAAEIIDISEDELYQKEIEEATIYSETEIKASIERKPQLNSNSKNTRYKTDAKLAKTVLANKGYTCEYADLQGLIHDTFISKKGVQYQEAHHLIPMKAQKHYKNKNIDIPENIVGLCPNCHRAIHNANKETKMKILERLYNNKIDDLKKVGIDITLEDLYNKYYV